MDVEFRCPHCGTLAAGPDHLLGRRVACTACAQPFTAEQATTAQLARFDPAGPLEPGTRLGRYHIVRLLGSGGMGAVYLAEDTALHRQVALKVPTRAAGSDSDEQFQREARAAAALDHPHLCPVYDFGSDGGRLFLAMKYVSGRPLSAAVTGDPWPNPLAAGLVRTLARALQHAHGCGLVHRDVKPANVLLTAAGEPVLTDFGLAVLRADAAAEAGRVCGTAAYMAPEQARGDTEAIGPSADVYALGVMLFELVAGRLPHTGSVRDTLARKLADPGPRLRTVRPDADPWLDAICGRAMAGEPADRFPSMAAFAAALDDYLSGDRVVDAAGEAGYSCISDALAVAVPGEVVRIRPGRYREAVAVTADITLVGDAAEVIIDGPVHLTAGQLRNLSLAGGVRVTAGRPTLTECHLSNETGSGLLIENPRTDPTLVACVVHDAVVGAVVQADANPTFRDCVFRDNADAGVLVRRGGRGGFDRCELTGNRGPGLAVEDAGDPTLTECRIRSNRGPGVRAVRHGRGRFDRCELAGNGRAGVLVEDDADPTVRGCRITGSGDGVFVQARGRGTFERCEITGHARCGVAVQDDGDPTVIDCVLTGNGYQGVSVYVGGRGTFVGNDLRGNARGPWELNPEAVVVRRGNRE